MKENKFFEENLGHLNSIAKDRHWIVINREDILRNLNLNNSSLFKENFNLDVMLMKIIEISSTKDLLVIIPVKIIEADGIFHFSDSKMNFHPSDSLGSSMLSEKKTIIERSFTGLNDTATLIKTAFHQQNFLMKCLFNFLDIEIRIKINGGNTQYLHEGSVIDVSINPVAILRNQPVIKLKKNKSIEPFFGLFSGRFSKFLGKHSVYFSRFNIRTVTQDNLNTLIQYIEEKELNTNRIVDRIVFPKNDLREEYLNLGLGGFITIVGIVFLILSNRFPTIQFKTCLITLLIVSFSIFLIYSVLKSILNNHKKKSEALQRMKIDNSIHMIPEYFQGVFTEILKSMSKTDYAEIFTAEHLLFWCSDPNNLEHIENPENYRIFLNQYSHDTNMKKSVLIDYLDAYFQHIQEKSLPNKEKIEIRELFYKYLNKKIDPEVFIRYMKEDFHDQFKKNYDLENYADASIFLMGIILAYFLTKIQKFDTKIKEKFQESEKQNIFLSNLYVWLCEVKKQKEDKLLLLQIKDWEYIILNESSVNKKKMDQIIGLVQSLKRLFSNKISAKNKMNTKNFQISERNYSKSSINHHNSSKNLNLAQLSRENLSKLKNTEKILWEDPDFLDAFKNNKINNK